VVPHAKCVSSPARRPASRRASRLLVAEGTRAGAARPRDGGAATGGEPAREGPDRDERARGRDLLGPPTGENEYITGKAFIPFFYGRDRTRQAYFYKGVGRVVFAGGGGFSRNWRVSRVEYDPNEPGRAR
jgi:hypothetical protein